MKLPHGFLARVKRPSKRMVVWGSVIATLAVVGGYALWSQQAWAQYRPSYAQWRQDIHAEVDDVVALPAGTDGERRTVVARYADIVKHIEDTQRAVCQPSEVVAWQVNVIKSLADMRTECEMMVADVGSFKARLHTVATYLQNDQAVAKIINAIPQSDELAEDAWSAQEVAWGQAAQSIKRLPVDEVFKPTQTLATTQVTAIEAAWSSVIKAHKAKDKKQYVVAQAALRAAYDGLHEITASSEETLAELVGQLQDSSVDAFGGDL